MSIVDQIGSNYRRFGAPATFGICVAIGVAFLIAWFSHSESLLANTAFTGFQFPWTMFTYPFAYTGSGGEFVPIIFTIYWITVVGPPIERDMGSTRFLIFFFVATFLGAIGAELGSMIAGRHVLLLYALIPEAALTVAWGTRYPGAQILLFLIIRTSAKWVAWFMVGLVVFYIGTQAPVIGFCATLPLLLTYLFAADKIPGVPYSLVLANRKETRARRKREEAFTNEVIDRKKEREEREKLRKLFENSFKDDEK